MAMPLCSGAKQCAFICRFESEAIASLQMEGLGCCRGCQCNCLCQRPGLSRSCARSGVKPRTCRIGRCDSRSVREEDARWCLRVALPSLRISLAWDDVVGSGATPRIASQLACILRLHALELARQCLYEKLCTLNTTTSTSPASPF